MPELILAWSYSPQHDEALTLVRNIPRLLVNPKSVGAFKWLLQPKPDRKRVKWNFAPDAMKDVLRAREWNDCTSS